ncbi:hypothetical protein ACHAWF_013734 [Thalassiosira exigua]
MRRRRLVLLDVQVRPPSGSADDVAPIRRRLLPQVRRAARLVATAAGTRRPGGFRPNLSLVNFFARFLELRPVVHLVAEPLRSFSHVQHLRPSRGQRKRLFPFRRTAEHHLRPRQRRQQQRSGSKLAVFVVFAGRHGIGSQSSQFPVGHRLQGALQRRTPGPRMPRGHAMGRRLHVGHDRRLRRGGGVRRFFRGGQAAPGGPAVPRKLPRQRSRRGRRRRESNRSARGIEGQRPRHQDRRRRAGAARRERDAVVQALPSHAAYARAGAGISCCWNSFPIFATTPMLIFWHNIMPRSLRYQLVYQKTRGNPLYIVEFLRSIIQSNALSFSVKERKWIYEELCIDMQLISEGVVELLAIKLKKLPTDVLTALKVMACFGSQIMTSVIELLDLEQFVPSMQAALELAVKEGIIEKAGPAFAFIHDTLQESTYNLIHATERNRLHKMIGMSLAHDPEVIKLAVDQINICKDSGILNPIEKAQFARLNLTAGKNAVRTSSYEQARGYFLAGISLLSARHWETQYELAIDLYEWSVSVCFMDGNVENSRIRLDAILTHARTFEDSLNARAMVAKLCVAQEKYAKGVKIILEVLEVLGEVFPSEVDAMLAKSEIEKTMPLLTTISRERILELPPLTEGSKLGAMKFLCLLIHFTNFYSPLFVHLISCRMIQITFAHGYCEDFISALVTYAHGMILYGNDIALMKRIKSTAENLIRGHPNEPSLTSRLTTMLATPKIMVEPCQAVVEHVSNAYKSARMVGDLDMANVLAVMLCVSTLCCVTDLSRLRSQAVNFLHEMERNKRMGPFRSVMTIFNACTTLIGDEADAKIETETNVELYRIAKETHNTYLMHHVILHQMHVHIIFRDHLMIIKLAEKYRTHAAKRVLDFFVDFYEGLAALVLARDTKQEEWISIGEKSVEAMTRLVSYSTWNFENKVSSRSWFVWKPELTGCLCNEV